MGIKENRANEKKEKEKTKKIETAKYFYELSKATFSITFLGSLALIFKDGTMTTSIIIGAISGIIMSIVFFSIGYKILNK